MYNFTLAIVLLHYAHAHALYNNIYYDRYKLTSICGAVLSLCLFVMFMCLIIDYVYTEVLALISDTS